MSREEIIVDVAQEKGVLQESLADSAVKEKTSDTSSHRPDYQKELSSDKAEPKTVTQAITQTNERIENDVILNSATTAKQIKSINADSQRRVIENNQIDLTLTSTSKKKRRGRSSGVSLRLSQSGGANLLGIVKSINFRVVSIV